MEGYLAIEKKENLMGCIVHDYWDNYYYYRLHIFQIQIKSIADHDGPSLANLFDKDYA